jgi:polar amino acid transport system substrate-binding protein
VSPMHAGRRGPGITALAALVAVVAIAAAIGCGSTSSDSSSAASAPPKTNATGSPAITVPASQLNQAGELRVCATVPSPPLAFYNDQHEFVGFDVELAAAIGDQLGLKTVEVPSVWDTIIAAVSTGKCDVIVDSMFITPERLKQVNFVPYLQVGQQFLIAKGGKPLGDPANDPTALCGRSIAVQNGSAESETIDGFIKECSKAGKPALKKVVFTAGPPALQAAQTGQVDAVFQDYPIMAYYAKLHPEQFSLNNGQILAPVTAGIAIPPGKDKLVAGIADALRAIAANGTYAKILAKWGTSGLALPDPGATVRHVTQ